MNIMIDADLTHLTVIDVDLMCIHGGVVGVDADVNLKQHWPYQFSAWEDKLSASQDSQQLATLLVQLYTWEHLCPVNLSVSLRTKIAAVWTCFASTAISARVVVLKSVWARGATTASHF